MASFSDYRIALQMRDVIQAMVREEVEKQRPRYQMGVVTSIDRVTRKCGVQFPGEAGSVSVNMGSIQPNQTGQVVRVEGLAGDRYIADVIGYTYSDRITRGTELGANVDLNTLITTGLYMQSHNVEATTALNYPAPFAGMLEVYSNTLDSAANMIWQRYTPYQAQPNRFYVRAYYNGTWGTWDMYGSEELSANVNLNNFITPGTYTQSDSAEATLALNYPEATRGLLEIFARLPNRVWQRYTTHTSGGSVFYERTYDGTTWSAWSKFVAYSDTDWVSLTSFYNTGFSTSGVAGSQALAYRILNNQVQFRGRVTTPTLNPNTTYSVALAMPTAIRPVESAACPVETSGGFLGWAIVDASTGNLNVHFKSPWTAATADIFFTNVGYMLG